MVNRNSLILYSVIILIILFKIKCYNLKQCKVKRKNLSNIDKDDEEMEKNKIDFLDLNQKLIEIRNHITSKNDRNNNDKLDISCNNVIEKEITNQQNNKDIQIKNEALDNINTKKTDNQETQNDNLKIEVTENANIQKTDNQETQYGECNLKACENKCIRTVEESTDLIIDLFVLIKKYKLEKTECQKNITNYVTNIKDCLLQEKQYGKACDNYSQAIEILKDNLMICKIKNKKSSGGCLEKSLGDCLENIYL